MNTMSIPLEVNSMPRVVGAGRGIHIKGKTQYFLPGLWVLHFYNYWGDLRVNGRSFDIKPGQVSVLPPGSRQEYFFRGPSEHLYAQFELPPASDSLLLAPVMIDWGKDFPLHFGELERAIGWFARQPMRTNLAIWTLLWECADRVSAAHSQPARSHPAVVRIVESIERRLHEPLYGEDLAREAGLSHQHLIRLFRAVNGTTVHRYISERRLQRALHLLMHSTLPIKAIAKEIGIPDLQQFNKTVRRNLGRSPRSIREGANL
jgi:AraC-like DNA-binding protein